MRALEEESAKRTTALAAGTGEVVVAYPDETLQDAIAKMLKGDVGRLPVVARDDGRKVVGYLGRADILAARLKWHDEEERREKGQILPERLMAR